jgi:hypothetical protein
MWEPRRLTTLWAFTACYRGSFTFYVNMSLIRPLFVAVLYKVKKDVSCGSEFIRLFSRNIALNRRRDFLKFPWPVNTVKKSAMLTTSSAGRSRGTEFCGASLSRDFGRICEVEGRTSFGSQIGSLRS